MNESIQIISDYSRKEDQQIASLKYINFFAMLFVTCLLISNILAPIPIEVYGLILPGGSFLFPLSYLLDNIITEVYGYKHARQIIWFAIVCHGIIAVFFWLTAQMSFNLPPEDAYSYRKILLFSPVVFVASLVSIIITQHLNSMVLSKLKVKQAFRNSLFFRCVSSSMIGISTDGLIFLPVIFYYILDIWQILYMVFCLFFVKISYELLFYPITFCVINFLKERENINVIDLYTKYTPFALETGYSERELKGIF